MKKKVFLISLGCAKNTVDSENMLALLKETQFSLVISPDDADIIIINTCGFILDAQEESVQTILEMAQYKQEGTCELLIVAGCLAQRYKKDLVSEIPEIDILLGTANFHNICKAIINFYSTREKLLAVNDNFDTYHELPRLLSTPQHYAYLKIAEGCDNFCTYCIIPQLRGKYRSRTIENILTEANNLVADGVKEIILIGEDITQYGKDLYGKIALVNLLKELVKIPKLRWIRLLYCYPNNFSDELINFIKTQPKICKYVDIPLQHSHNEILRKMGRNITEEEIRTLIVKLRRAIPNIVIRSTFIVGFPGETEEHFNNLLNFLKEAKLDYVGAFTYSKEKGTPAEKLPQQIPEKNKEIRRQILMNQQYAIVKEKHNELLNHYQWVQVDNLSDEVDHLYICRSESQAPEIDPAVLVFSEETLVPGQLVKVKITHLQDYDLIGEVEK